MVTCKIDKVNEKLKNRIRVDTVDEWCQNVSALQRAETTGMSGDASINAINFLELIAEFCVI